MIDTAELRKIVSDFRRSASPSNGNALDHCTNQDLKQVINATADMMNAFIKKLEQ